MDATFLRERIAKKKALIVAWEDAALELSSGAIESYKLDTGQSVQTVKKQDIGMLKNYIDGLYNDLAVLQARLTGSGQVTSVPSW